MKYIIIFLSLFILFFKTSAIGTEKEASKINVEIKKGGAVTAFVKEDGFKLSEKAKVNLGVSFKALTGNGPWRIPKSALVRIKHSTGVYRRWNGWITMVLVSILNQENNHFTIKSIDLQDGDDIAIKGVSFLRMTEADLNSDTVDACAH